MNMLLKTQVSVLYHEGWTVYEIANEIGVPVEEVIECCNELA